MRASRAWVLCAVVMPLMACGPEGFEDDASSPQSGAEAMSSEQESSADGEFGQLEQDLKLTPKCTKGYAEAYCMRFSSFGNAYGVYGCHNGKKWLKKKTVLCGTCVDHGLTLSCGTSA